MLNQREFAFKIMLAIIFHIPLTGISIDQVMTTNILVYTDNFFETINLAVFKVVAPIVMRLLLKIK